MPTFFRELCQYLKIIHILAIDMKKIETFPVILAALLIGGSAISSCKKEEPAIPPTTAS